MNDELLAWHTPHWDRFVTQLHHDRLSHAYLLAGPAETGKSTLAEQMAARLLCQGASGSELACGTCSRCRLIAAGTHPDLLRVTLKESKQILVDQVRSLGEWAQQTSQQGGVKVCLIDPADCLNIQASNALLKSLEEPPKDTILILVTNRPARLLPTLRSRCQRLEVSLPERDVAVRWLASRIPGDQDPELLLEIAGGSPLRVTNHLSDEYLALRKAVAEKLTPLATGQLSPLTAAAAFSSSDPVMVLDIFYQLIADSLAWSLSGGQVLRNHDLRTEIESYSNSVDVSQRHAMIDRLTSARSTLSGTSNANVQMLLEWMLAEAA
ncbi:MAG: DNA polymerase III subunit delta' [Proteobacteria bacterium]|nr:DNA polymerase III subunit delta' [Pseudomonadota bacterium]